MNSVNASEKFIFLHCFSSLLPVLQGLKARNFIHSKIEENIKKKLQESDKEPKHRDALQQLIDSSKKNGEPFSMQVLTSSHHVYSSPTASLLSFFL